MLKNKKVKVGNAEQSKAIQEKAFELGWRWRDVDSKYEHIKYILHTTIYFTENKEMDYTRTGYSSECENYEEVSVEWILGIEKKSIFKVGDRVFDYQFGHGTVNGKLGRFGAYKLSIEFDNREVRAYTEDGRLHETAIAPTLSLTEYTLDGFSQERSIDYKDYIGKWGMFYDKSKIDKDIHISKLLRYEDNGIGYPFETLDECAFSGFEPLTEEQIKILNLK